MHVAIAGFHHETNTFAAKHAEYEDFEKADGWPALAKGAEIFKALKGCNIPISGFIEQAKKYNWQLEPLLWCNAPPAGRVTRDAYERITMQMLTELQPLQGVVDAIYLDLHGAMVTESFDDGEGELLHRIRRIMGNDIPIIVSLDLHANVTREMFELTNVMVGFKTYPHIDMAETGERAAHILHHIQRRGQVPFKAMAKLPYLIPITSQCTLIEPAATIYRKLTQLEATSGMVTASFLMGFPPADIKECGPAIVVYADDEPVAQAVCQQLEEKLLESERDFKSKLWTPKDAVAYGQQFYEGKPTILADTQDNPGAGASSDTTGIIHELIEQDVSGAVVACFYDPENAELAHRCGVGKQLFMTLGGKAPGDDPLENVFMVEKVSEGEFKATGPVYGGSTMKLGKMALISRKGVKIIVTSRKVQAADQAIFRHMGVDPAMQRILVLKSSVHFRADFDPIARKTLIVESPGLNIENPEQLPYESIRSDVRLRPEGKTRKQLES